MQIVVVMKKIFLLSIVLLSFSIQGMSQKVERYKGKMKIPTEIAHMKGLVANLSPASRPSVDESGGGWYDYYVDSQGRRIKHGDFVYRSGNDVYYSEMSEIHGHFLHGKKSGKWTLRCLKENGTYDDKSFYLEVNYKNDTLNGPYTLKGDFFRTEYATGKFCNGHLCGDIFMNSGGNVISMSVGNDGLPIFCRITDNSGIPITQYRVFETGALILLYEEDESTGETNYIYVPFDTLRWVKGGILPTRDSVFDEQDVVFHGNSCAKIKQVARNQIIEKCQVRNFGVEYESEVLPDILSKLGARLDGWDLTYTPIPVSRKTTKKTPQKTPQVTTHSEIRKCENRI